MGIRVANEGQPGDIFGLEIREAVLPLRGLLRVGEVVGVPGCSKADQTKKEQHIALELELN